MNRVWHLIHQDYLGYWPEGLAAPRPAPSGLVSTKKLNIIFFKSTNSLRTQLSSRRNNLKLFSYETPLWSFLQILKNRLAFIHKWFLDIDDLQRPDWICFDLLLASANFPAHQRHRDISHYLRGRFPFLLTKRSWISRWTLCVNHLVFDGIHRFLSCQSCHFAIQS